MTSATGTQDANRPAIPMAGPTRRLGRPMAFLASALLVAGITYVVGPLLQAAPASVSAPAIPVPGDIAPIVNGDQPATGATAGGRLPVADRLAFWADRVKANPGDFLSLVQLALVEAEGARLRVDLDGYERALADIDRSLTLVPAYPPTIRARGSIRFALHDFAGALADARAVLDAAPSDAAALALRADAQLELGQLEAATADYGRLAETAPGPWLDVRRARLASVTGDGERAVSLARKAVVDGAILDPEEAGFYAYALGEYARLAGDAATSRSSFAAALYVRPTDVGALVGLARIDAFEGRTSQAIAGLQAAAAIVPQPETLALLGDLQARQGDTTAATATFKTVRFIERLGSIQGQVYDRQLLRFELDHQGASSAVLGAARASLAVRPDAGGHDLVAWALYRLGRFDEAAAEIAAARSSGADDARLRFHEGAIAMARGDAAGGTLLAAAIADGPALDPIERVEATKLALQGGGA